MQQNLVSFREHRELGEVVWLRDYRRGLTLAAEQKKPVLLLFQEVPGCSTCVRFGQDVLTHPLMVEFIARHFVAIAIFNNRAGPDAEILRQFGEASWNNPVVHFLGSDGRELLPRLADRYDALGLHEKLTAVLDKLNVEIPGYFRLLRRDLVAEYGLSKSVTYATPCFWSGETSLAQHPSVITTDAGWIDGEEVVQVRFDPHLRETPDIDAYAREEGFAPIDGHAFALDREPQFYLRKNRARHLPLTPAQRTQMNMALPYRRPLDDILSPQQRIWLDDPRLEKVAHDDLYRDDIRESWPLVAERLADIPQLELAQGVSASETRAGKLQIEISNGEHSLFADEPVSVGGLGSGLSPYELVSAGLAACTIMTMRVYAERKGIPLERAHALIQHEKVPGMEPADKFTRTIKLDGPLDQEQRQKLLAIGDRCPVDLTLMRGSDVQTTLSEE